MDDLRVILFTELNARFLQSVTLVQYNKRHITDLLKKNTFMVCAGFSVLKT